MIVNLTNEGAKWVCREVCKIIYKGDAEKAEKKGNQESRANAFKWALRDADEGDFEAVVKAVANSGYHFKDIDPEKVVDAFKKVVKKLPETVAVPTTKPVEVEEPNEPEDDEGEGDDDDDDQD